MELPMYMLWLALATVWTEFDKLCINCESFGSFLIVKAVSSFPKAGRLDMLPGEVAIWR
jgi:hypothetical protein